MHVHFFIHVNEKRLNILNIGLDYLKTMQEFFISGLFTLNDGKVHT